MSQRLWTSVQQVALLISHGAHKYCQNFSHEPLPNVEPEEADKHGLQQRVTSDLWPLTPRRGLMWSSRKFENHFKNQLYVFDLLFYSWWFSVWTLLLFVSSLLIRLCAFNLKSFGRLRFPLILTRLINELKCLLSSVWSRAGGFFSSQPSSESLIVNIGVGSRSQRSRRF